MVNISFCIFNTDIVNKIKIIPFRFLFEASILFQLFFDETIRVIDKFHFLFYYNYY